MTEQRIKLTIDKRGERLDSALVQALPNLSRTYCQRLIKSGLVTVDGLSVRPSHRLSGTEVIWVIIPESEDSELVPEDIPLAIISEDDDILVIDKPAGMVVHPAAGNETGTLVNALIHHCPNLPGISGERRPGIVHRLDKHTSGLIVVAKTDTALRNLQKQFQKRTVEKKYQALVEGRLGKQQFVVEAPIGRDPSDRKKMAVISPGAGIKSRSAETRFSLQKLYGNYSLLNCYPLTGRTHQIRVHLAYIGYPIVGDSKYGRRKPTLKFWRTFLHAAELSFQHPTTNYQLSFYSQLPSELSDLLATLQLQE